MSFFRNIQKDWRNNMAAQKSNKQKRREILAARGNLPPHLVRKAKQKA